MRRIISLFILSLLGIAVYSQEQYVTQVTITDLDNQQLTTKVQNTLTELITELNTAHAQKRVPNFNSMNIDASTMNSLSMLWENSAFRCVEPEIVESALKVVGGEYEIRNLPFLFTDLDKDDQYHEGVITFNKQGVLTSFHMAISQNLYVKVMQSNKTLTDFRRRQIILDYVEQFRTSYNTKDIKFINQVFSEDALIITGRVVTPKKETRYSREFGMTSFDVGPKVEFTRQNKQQYIRKLRRIFKNNRKIKVSFDDIKVVMHPTDANWYGVTLKQGWTSDNYHDDGYLFLLWDFSDENAPVIHVRTWQPDKIGNREITEDEIFSIDDVNIVR